jgi:endonuclease/exonuclease/phosphatase family metal-dependent hydrolase
MAKINFIFVVLTMLCFSCGSTKKLAATFTPLTVLTYNIHHGNPPSQSKSIIDLDTIAATIQASGAGLVAIQELDSMTVRSNKVYQLKALAEKLGMHYHFERTIPYEGGAYGIGILSKYPLETITAYPLPEVNGVKTEPRKLLLAKVVINKRLVYFGCTHVDYKNKEVNMLQVQEIVKVLTPIKKQRVVIGGDFNAVPTEASMQYMATQYAHAGDYNGLTIPVLNPKKKIDFIFYQSRQLRLEQDSVLTAHNYGSDHLPVIAQFEVRK